MLEKLRICRRRSTPLTKPQMIPYLIRGLYNPAYQSVMMVNQPATTTDFIAIIDFTPTHSLLGRPAVPNFVSPYPTGNDSPSLSPYGYARKCYTCQGYGHFARECPHSIPRHFQSDISGDLQADSSEQTGHIGVFQAHQHIAFSAINSPVIKVDVFRIGATKAMVDSGAQNSVICQSLLTGRSAFKIRPPPFYRNIDGSIVQNVVGECSLTVRYKGVLVDLNHVVESSIYPLVLGIVWIVQSGAVVKGNSGRVEVLMLNQIHGLETKETVQQGLYQQDRAIRVQDSRLRKLEVENAKIKKDLNNRRRQTATVTGAPPRTVLTST